MAVPSCNPRNGFKTVVLRTVFAFAFLQISICSASAVMGFSTRQVPLQAGTSVSAPMGGKLAATVTGTMGFTAATTLVSSIPNPLASLIPSVRTNAVSNSDRSGQSTAQDPPLRVMILGDSMSQGDEGDWTWRYRLWEWFKAQDIAVDFVGPYVGTQESDSPAASSPASSPSPSPSPSLLRGAPQLSPTIKDKGEYASGVSPDFDSHHFAAWGRAAGWIPDLVETTVAEYPTDLLLLMLGFNDIAWLGSTGSDLLINIKKVITKARAANPNLKFAVANVPHRSLIDGRMDIPLHTDTFNNLLKVAIPTWTTAESPIHMVELRQNYDCETARCPVGYDGIHPNVLGEYQVARAFTLTLVKDFHIGTSPLEIPGYIHP